MPKLKRTHSIDQFSADESFDEELSNSGSNGRSPPQQRNAANARERARMRVLSRAFCRLKTTLPWVPADTKLSKLDTLRLATSYIAHLRSALDEEPADQGSMHPLTLTWPFSFQPGAVGSSQNCSDTNNLNPRETWDMPINTSQSHENHQSASYCMNRRHSIGQTTPMYT